MKLFIRGGFLYRAQRLALGFLVACLLRLLMATWRMRSTGENPLAARAVAGAAPVVLVAWHRGLAVMLALFRGRGLLVPVSRSRDGDWISAVLYFLGFDVSLRGSSSDGGGVLLRRLIRAVRSGRSAGLLPDGPRGPAGVVKPGALAVARATGARLHPIRVEVSRAFEFASWDRTLLPLPFAKVTCHFGPALDAACSVEVLSESLGPSERRAE